MDTTSFYLPSTHVKDTPYTVANRRAYSCRLPLQKLQLHRLNNILHTVSYKCLCVKGRLDANNQPYVERCPFFLLHD